MTLSSSGAVAPCDRGKNLSILLVDDEEAPRTIFAAVLRKASHEVMAVSHGRDAIFEMETGRFDVILTDIVMPDIDGLEIITAAKSLQPRARIVAMSGGTNHLAPSFCLKLAAALGGGATLMKPFSLPELLIAVKGSLQSSSTSTDRVFA
jgi:CheY-like chemotaxis protein